MGNTPNIRFKGFTDDWEQRKLGDVGSVSMCRRIFKEQTSESGDIPFYKIGTFGGQADAYISSELFVEYRSKYPYPKEGDILISASGSIGRTVEFTGKNEYYQDSNIVWLSHDDRLDNAFLKCFYSVVKWAGIEGSTIKRLYNDNILNTVICMPSVDEQRKIGTFLKELDHLITLHQRKCDETKELKKFMLQKMFPKNGEKKPEIRFEGFTDDWEQRKVSELCSISTGKSNTQDKVEDGEYPFYVRSPIIERSTKYLYDEEAVLTVGDGVGTGKVFHYVNGKYDLHQRCYRMYDFTDELNAHYFYHTFSKLFYKRVMAMTAKTSVDSVRLEMIANMEIPAPKIEEQVKIGTYFDNLDNLITLHQRKCDEIKEIKKFMLQNMFPQKG